MDHEHDLARAILSLAEAIRELSHNEIKLILFRIEQKQDKLMSQITDFAATVQASFDAVSADLDKITDGITALDKLIADFQNSPGTLNPADQAALDKIVASSAALKAKADAIDITPPTPPTA